MTVFLVSFGLILANFLRTSHTIFIKRSGEKRHNCIFFRLLKLQNENKKFQLNLIIFDRFINSFFGKFCAQITPSNLLNILMYFDFKIDQPFPNYQAQKVKFPKFT